MQYNKNNSPKPESLNKSGELYERALKSLAGGVNSNVRLSETPHPLFYKEAHGSKIIDVDGNEYIDYMLGGGPLYLDILLNLFLMPLQKHPCMAKYFKGNMK